MENNFNYKEDIQIHWTNEAKPLTTNYIFSC